MTKVKKGYSSKRIFYIQLLANAVAGGLIGYYIVAHKLLAIVVFVVLIVIMNLLYRIRETRGEIIVDEFLRSIDEKASAISFKIMMITSVFLGLWLNYMNYIRYSRVIMYMASSGLILYLTSYGTIRYSYYQKLNKK